MELKHDSIIVRDPKICGGAPVIKGTRVRVKAILDNLAEGHTPQEIILSYPSLTLENISAAITFAITTKDDNLFSLPDHLMT